ncbi:cysteine biosynthesis protein CysZ [Pseudoroseomonas rhizosphaerae]|uniref:Cysteine biosynthesis protein CysZ n=1 Tax=Teichococcus rhizosphaerae TaxID=1335062 RepID=A0A2C7AJ16_9PROT|nr:EI24 domain-containing protein [Pseudoroseomonas rhizosphaerae]PHK96767.1 cysteine biosynthesis protein CysZ [Pseudoroseomonas rhizosphaerae]
MRAIATSLVLPLRQLTHPGFRAPLLKGLGLSILAFAGLAWLADWGVGVLAGGEGWLATLAGLLGGALVLVGAIWLFVPVLLALTSLFVDEVAEAVERRFYPGLPPAGGASLPAQVWASLRMSVRLLALSLLILPLGLVAPPVGVVLFWAVAAVSMGYGLFDGVAQRRLPVAEANALRRARRTEVLALGGVLAALAVVPIANLLVPVLGTAAMTHLFHRRPDGAPAPRG